MSEGKQRFDDWMDGMDVLLDEFMHDLPKEVSSKLDYSIESLDVLEAWLLDKYPTYEALRDDPDVTALDAGTRYFGQVLVKQLGGRWDYNPGGPPQIRDIGLGDKAPMFIPMYMVSSVTDRRTGRHLRTIAEANMDG